MFSSILLARQHIHRSVSQPVQNKDRGYIQNKDRGYIVSNGIISFKQAHNLPVAFAAQHVCSALLASSNHRLHLSLCNQGLCLRRASPTTALFSTEIG